MDGWMNEWMGHERLVSYTVCLMARITYMNIWCDAVPSTTAAIDTTNIAVVGFIIRRIGIIIAIGE